MSRATEVNHPLIKRSLTTLRNKETGPEPFRCEIRRLAVLLAYEATKDLQLTSTTVTTAMSPAMGHCLAQRIGIVPILRAGLGMVEPVLDLLPDSQVWHLGLYRDEQTARPVEYYSKIPEERPVDVALVLDPMLATGGSVLAALSVLQRWGVPSAKVLAIIASHEGIERVTAEFPDTQIFVCAIDAQLNNQKFIVPGLGDAGDRIFNTLESKQPDG